MMKIVGVLLMVVILCSLSTFSTAAKPDAEWVDKCFKDHSDGAASQDTIKNYCVCLNNKRNEGDSQSPRLFEREHIADSTWCCKEVDWR